MVINYSGYPGDSEDKRQKIKDKRQLKRIIVITIRQIVGSRKKYVAIAVF